MHKKGYGFHTNTFVQEKDKSAKKCNDAITKLTESGIDFVHDIEVETVHNKLGAWLGISFKCEADYVLAKLLVLNHIKKIED